MKNEKRKRRIFHAVGALSVAVLLATGMTGCVSSGQEQIIEETDSSIQTIWTGKEENIDKAVLENQAAVVRVMQENRYGSGVLWSVEGDRLIVVTNWHVLAESEWAEWEASEEESCKEEGVSLVPTAGGSLQFADGSEAAFRLVFYDAECDVAFLETELLEVAEETREKIRLVSTQAACYQSLKKGDEIGIVGAGEDGTTLFVTGSVIDKSWFLEDFGMEMLYLDGMVKPGMSGGGIFDAHGHYVGMLTGGTREECAGVPFPVIKKIYENKSYSSENSNR
ncbi:MAG: trypsin-like peptidase domain-containing protein [Clostridiales bacterium]|nr:trypsin-like peptidase domain-containing protein [Clostridiales bacterium]